MDIIVGQLQEIALTAAYTAASALGSYAIFLGRQWLLRWRLETALGRAAGQALTLIAANPALRSLGEAALAEAIDTAVGRFAPYLRTSIPGTLKALGVPDDRLEPMLRGEVGKLLAALWPATAAAPGLLVQGETLSLSPPVAFEARA